MVKKIFLLTFMAIGMTACSKSDDTPMNSGDNNKLLGTWVGTAEVIAEKPAQQRYLLHRLKPLRFFRLGCV
jgi:hypothetical protein